MTAAANQNGAPPTGGEAAIRAAIEAARVVPFPRKGDGSDDSHLGLAFLQRNDIGNAERFIRRKGGDFIFVKDVGWYSWTGTHWSLDAGETQAQIAAQEVAIVIRAEANALEARGPGPNDDADEFAERVDKHRRWAVASGNSNRLVAMLREAAPHLERTVDALDADPWRFNVENGTLVFERAALARGEDSVRLMPHSRDDLITRVAPVAFDPDAACKNFDAFLARVLPSAAVRDTARAC